MLGDVISLIEFIRDFLERGIDRNQNLISNFVDPAFSNFTRVHNNYIQAFHQYEGEINRNPLNLRLVVEKIRNDRLFSEHLRSDLVASLSAENVLLYEFIGTISRYLESPGTMIFQRSIPWSNVRRDSLVHVLTWINNLASEDLMSSGLFDDIETLMRSREMILTSENLVSNLVFASTRGWGSDAYLIDTSERTLEPENQLNFSKRYLATKYLFFVIKDTQENYHLVADSYHRLKFDFLGINNS
jgi:hypothetical protein